MKNNTLFKGWLAVALGWLALFAAPLHSAAGQGTADGLAIGQTWKVDDGLELTFVKVLQDTRRPIGATNKKTGDAVVVLKAQMKHQPARLYKVRLNYYSGVFPFPHATKDANDNWLKARYFVNLDKLTPRPVVGKKIVPSDYRLFLYAGVDRILKPF